jgi:hypothetical protein
MKKVKIENSVGCGIMTLIFVVLAITLIIKTIG